MNRTLTFLVTGVFWALMMFFLIQRELLPYLELQAPPSYRSMLREKKESGVVMQDVFFGMEKIGRVETVTEVLKGKGHRIRSFSRLNLTQVPGMDKFPGSDHVLTGRTTTVINADYQLEKFESKGKMFGFPIHVEGHREGTDLVVTYKILMFKETSRIENFPEDLTLAVDDMIPMVSGGRQRVGKKWKIKVLRPNLMGKKSVEIADAFAEVISREGRYYENRLVQVYRVEIKWKLDPNHDRTADYILFIDDDGKILEQEMKFSGQTLRFVLVEERKLSPEEAAGWTFGNR